MLDIAVNTMMKYVWDKHKYSRYDVEAQTLNHFDAISADVTKVLRWLNRNIEECTAVALECDDDFACKVTIDECLPVKRRRCGDIDGVPGGSKRVGMIILCEIQVGTAWTGTEPIKCWKICNIWVIM